MSTKPSVFKRYPKLATLILSTVIFAITVSLLAFILRLNVLQDFEGGEKYSVADKIKYSIRCHNRRYIKLRENRPNKNELILPVTKYETIKFNETIRQFGKENNVLVIDLANHVPGTKEFIYDPIHINKKGSVMVSNKIAKEISSYLKKIGYSQKNKK